MTITTLLAKGFLILLIAEFVVERGLAWLNARHSARLRGTFPAELNGLIAPEAFQRSIDYTLARTRFGHMYALASALVVYGFVNYGLSILPSFASYASEYIWDDVRFIGVLSFGLVGFFSALVFTPFDLWHTFVLEARFGFNRTTFPRWVLDRVLGTLVAALLGGPLLFAVFHLIYFGGEWWWLIAAAVVIGWQFLMMLIAPLFIAPLFNKYTPLPDGELKDALHALAKRCAFPLGGIFTMDGSKRSGHSNAFFTGVGASRRIVLFDTLVQQLSTGELAAVLAHEIGHWKLRHIPRRLILSCAATVAGFYVLSLVLQWHPLYIAFGAGAMSEDKGLLLVLLLSGPALFWLAPLGAWLSRRDEFQADAYAGQHSSAAELKQALLKLTEKNLSNPLPHPWYSAWNHSHPTLLERLKALGV